MSSGQCNCSCCSKKNIDCSNCCCNRNCSHSKNVQPDGIWDLSNMIGAKVKIASISGYFNYNVQDFSKTYTVVDIKFRVSLDGKAITLVYLDGITGTFTLKDLEFITVRN